MKPYSAAREADHAPDRAHAVVAAHDHAREADPDRQLTRSELKFNSF